MYLQKVKKGKKLEKNNILLASWRSVTKIAGSGSVSQRCGSGTKCTGFEWRVCGFLLLSVVNCRKALSDLLPSAVLRRTGEAKEERTKDTKEERTRDTKEERTKNTKEDRTKDAKEERGEDVEKGEHGFCLLYSTPGAIIREGSRLLHVKKCRFVLTVQ